MQARLKSTKRFHSVRSLNFYKGVLTRVQCHEIGKGRILLSMCGVQKLPLDFGFNHGNQNQPISNGTKLLLVYLLLKTRQSSITINIRNKISKNLTCRPSVRSHASLAHLDAFFRPSIFPIQFLLRKCDQNDPRQDQAPRSPRHHHSKTKTSV